MPEQTQVQPQVEQAQRTAPWKVFLQELEKEEKKENAGKPQEYMQATKECAFDSLAG